MSENHAPVLLANSVVLQEIELPDSSICSETDLYYLVERGGAVVDWHERQLLVGPWSSVDFGTYFNCFSAAVWVRETVLDDLAFELDVEGVCQVELWHTMESERSVLLSAQRSDVGPVRVAELCALSEGIVTVRVKALNDAVTIFGGRWTTTTPAVRTVRLGVGITTFNRQEYVRRNIALLQRYASSAPSRLADTRVQVVDNGSNLDDSFPVGDLQVEVLPNRNLGGAGGFARNLMEFRQGGWATHVLFMDDDIVIQPAAIDRTRMFLTYTRDPETSVSGAMLDESDVATQFESGANFLTRSASPIRPGRSNLDLRKKCSLLENAKEQTADYGAWWFYAFPIGATSENPLPVFVRGDDAAWGLTHAGRKIASMNGIGIWHQAFEQKNGPMMWHLEARNFALVSVLCDDDFGRVHFLTRLLTNTGRAMLAMKYESADKMMQGARDFLAGPDRWLTLDHVTELDRLRTVCDERPMVIPADQRVPEFHDSVGVFRRLRAIFALLLLSGHVLPEAVSVGRRRAVPVQARSISAPVGREELLYFHGATSEGFVAKRDRRRFFALVSELGSLTCFAWRRFPKVVASYRARRAEFVSDAYWMSQFGLSELTSQRKAS